MPYIVFDTISDTDTYDFENSFQNESYQDHCVKELCWVSDEVWNYINETAAKYPPRTNDDEDDGEDDDENEDVYFIESARIYLAIRLQACKVVKFDDDTVKDYLANNTIKFLLTVIRKLIEEEIPFEIDGEKNTVVYALSVIETLYAEHREVYDYVMKMSIIGPRVAEYLSGLREKLPECLFLADIKTTWDIYSIAEVFESFKDIKVKAQKYGLSTNFVTEPSETDLSSFESELKMMFEYIDNIVQEAKSEVNKQLNEIEQRIAVNKAMLTELENNQNKTYEHTMKIFRLESNIRNDKFEYESTKSRGMYNKSSEIKARLDEFYKVFNLDNISALATKLGIGLEKKEDTDNDLKYDNEYKS